MHDLVLSPESKPQHEMQVGHINMGSIKHMLLEQGSEGKGKAKSLRTNRGDTPLAISDLLQRQFNPPMALMESHNGML